MVAMQALVDSSDEVVAVVPVWPNLTAQPARSRRAWVIAAAVEQAWSLDLIGLLSAVTPATRVLIVNAPNNPTGWTLERAEQRRCSTCRHTGTWIIADGSTNACITAGGAPRMRRASLDIATPRDRLVVVHSFSKSFPHDRLAAGWMVAPAAPTHPRAS